MEKEWLERPKFANKTILKKNSFDLFGDQPPGNSIIRPRIWQKQLINLLRRRLVSYLPTRKDLLLHAGPGAGKTLGALLGFREMQKEGLVSHLLVFCHRNIIAEQWRKSSDLVGLKLEELESSLAIDNNNINVDGWVITYQGASRKSEIVLEIFKVIKNISVLAIADEVHHLGVDPDEPEGAVWGRTFLNLTNPCRLRIGLTGTPFRADNLAFCSGKRVCLKFINA